MTVALYQAHGKGGVRADCSKCGDPDYRAIHGCDSPVSTPTFIIPCPNPSCKKGCDFCDYNQRGKKEYFICPNQIVDFETGMLLYSFQMMENGIHPFDSELMDMPYSFQQAHSHYRGIKAGLE